VGPEVLTAVTGALTALLALSFGVPQFLHVRRTRSVAGISLPSITNSLVSTTAWLAYGVWLGDVWVTVTSIVGLPALAAAGWVALRHGASRRGMWVPALWSATLLLALLVTPVLPTAFATVLGASVLWYVTPAALTAWRSADVSGIAAGTWLLLLADGLVAGAYGVLADVPAYLVYAVTAALGAMAVLARLWWRWSPDCGECPPVAGCVCP
jgi:uncharacterized protein with PQ loop repeat